MATTLDFIITAHDRASKVFKDVGDAGEKSGGRLSKIGPGATVALAAAGVAAVKFGADSVQAYSDAEQSQARLRDAFDKFPALADTNISKLQEMNSALSLKTKFDDDATASGQAVLAQFGLTGKQITDLTPLLQDYAAKTGKDMPTAAQDLGKALLGSGKALKGIGVDFSDAGSVGANFDQIMGGLRSQVGGFAEKEGATAAGKTAILKNQFGELQETVGSKLLPVLTDLTAAGLAIVSWINDNQGAALALGVTFTILAGTIAVAANWLTISTTAIRIVTAAQWLWNAAMSANPIGLIIAGIVLLVAGFLWLWNNVDGFKQFFLNAWANIQKAVSNVVDWVKANWPLLVGILTGGISLAVTFIIQHWDQIKQGASDVVSSITGFFSSLPGKIGSALGTIVDKVTSPFRSAFGAIASLWNDTVGTIGFTVPDWVPGVGGKSFKVPTIPGYATGTSYAAPGWGWVGENGPELLRFRGGEQVVPTGQSMRMAGGPVDLSDSTVERLAAAILAGAAVVADGAVAGAQRVARTAGARSGLRATATGA